MKKTISIIMALALAAILSTAAFVARHAKSEKCKNPK